MTLSQDQYQFSLRTLTLHHTTLHFYYGNAQFYVNTEGKANAPVVN